MLLRSLLAPWYAASLACRYQLLQVDAGGWRRPHDFVFPDAGDGRVSDMHLAVVNNNNEREKGTPAPDPPLPPTFSLATLPPPSPAHALSFGTPFHGRTTYAASLFRPHDLPPPALLLASGSEDNTLKLTSYSPAARSLEPLADLSTFQSGARCVATSAGSSSTLVAAGGGRLQLDM
jgi:hypothetical protein